MYIDQIKLNDFRTFRDSEITFVHPDLDFSAVGIPKPRFPNVNLLLGNNGFGKTALLKAIALAALGPAVRSSGIYAYRLVRREPAGSKSQNGKQPQQPKEAVIEAVFTPHQQDQVGVHEKVESLIKVVRRGDLEELEWAHSEDKRWHPIFMSRSDAFFFVGYGATRRVERPERVDFATRSSSAFERAQRVQSLFEEAHSLIPLNSWLPEFKARNKGRYTQVVHLINRLMGTGHYTFGGEMQDREFVFERGGLKVPFPAMSDGYRAYLGWIGDLLYHVCMTCPPGKKLVENRGIVMVDEIDLHLHPKWQMKVLPTLARALPNIQFVVTSHSPLIVGSLEWMNIILMSPGTKQSSRPQRIRWAIHGLDADQVLLTEFFGLGSTRVASKKRRLKELTLQAREGDTEAAKKLLDEMSRGLEETPQ
jgi:predicted ATP-binding protein involved in virulence